MAVPGISTVGVLLGAKVGTPSGNTVPAEFHLLERINSIGGISLETNQIDASALEDEIEKMIAGRASTGGTVPITVNVTDATITDWESVFTASKAATAAGKSICFVNYNPDRQKMFAFWAQTPPAFPMPQEDQNGLETVEITLTINQYVGPVAAVKPLASVSLGE